MHVFKCIYFILHISVFYYRPNEVYGKVMFSRASVSLFTGGVSVPGCTTGHMTRGSLSRGVPVWGSLLGDSPPFTVMSRWYASYWKAFLLEVFS